MGVYVRCFPPGMFSHPGVPIQCYGVPIKWNGFHSYWAFPCNWRFHLMYELHVIDYLLFNYFILGSENQPKNV